MNNKPRKNGFSLTEVLLAVGTLAVGMSLVAGLYPAGILFTMHATERSIAAAVADEAFAKIKLAAISPASLSTNQHELLPGVLSRPLAVTEYFYPSEPGVAPQQKKYCWQAICRRAGERAVQVTVFVCRRVGSGRIYRNSLNPFDRNGALAVPSPVPVSVSAAGGTVITIDDPQSEAFIGDGSTIVDDETGLMYRVHDRDGAEIYLNRSWQGALSGAVWVVPPPFGGGRNPCVAVYQRVVMF